MSFSRSGRFLLALLVALVGVRGGAGLEIQFDYSYDGGGFFAAQDRRDALESAASLLEGLITDNLSAIVPSGPNATWTATFVNPFTGGEASEVDITIPATVLKIYVGGHDLPGNEVGFGGPGGYNSFGSTAWNTTVSTRGQVGAGAGLPTDFGPWGGSIAFDTIGGDGLARDWHFGIGTAPTAGSTDFYTTAVHELTHVLGFGISKSWQTYVGSGNSLFNGPSATSFYGGAVPLLAGGDGSHWQEGLQSKSTWTGLIAETAMDPTQNLGARKTLTQLDLAALQDIGWNLTSTNTVLAADANRDGKVDLTDFGTMKQNFGTAFGPQRGDFDGDGKVNLSDFGILKANFGGGGSAVVPEPATLTLALLAFAFLGCRRLRAR